MPKCIEGIRLVDLGLAVTEFGCLEGCKIESGILSAKGKIDCSN